MHLTGILASELLGLLLVACSMPTPRSPQGDAAPARASGSAASALSKQISARLVKQGYQVVGRDEQVVYWRTESVTGTLFSKTVCMSELQLRQQADSAQQSKDVLHQPRTPRCLGAVCSGPDGGG